MDDYQSELEITLLSLRAHCATATADGQTSSVLIKFVADILIGLVQDYHLHEARLDQILCSHSLTSPNHLASLEEILSAPLDLPTSSSSSSVTQYEQCVTERYVDEAVRHNQFSGEHFWGTEGHSKSLHLTQF